MSRLKLLLLTFLTMLSLGTALAVAPAFAANASSQSACDTLNELDSSQGCGSDASKTVVSSLVSTIVNVLSLILGAVAVIMIIVGGFKYVTSGGASDKISGAKNTILFAVIGLVVASLAQFIVHFALSSVK